MDEIIIDDGTYTDGTTTVTVTGGETNPSNVTIDMLKEGVKAGSWSKQMGGRRHRGSKKAHKKSRKGNKMLSSWVAFVKKVQRDEQISYSDAMKRASARKKEWKRGQMGGQSMSMGKHASMNMSQMGGDPMVPGDPDYVDTNTSSIEGEDETYGGRRRRRTKRRGSRKRRGTKRRR